MTESPQPISLERLRRNVAVQVQATSLRFMARRVGMSPSGLSKFLEGAMPYSAIRRKLFEWWEREGGKPSAEVSTELATDALTALVHDLPSDARRGAVQELLGVLREAHKQDGVPMPQWLADLSGRPRPPADPPAEG
ncbi:MAG TPA: hypothetical protein VFE05_09570 [Longimicrobiaceae bacterium]|jgi:hypothetical protein|nr:hypothetical protein [Longimicrobiaceae bacterium]